MKFTSLPGSHSQSGQESFVFGILDGLENGFFLEIGAFHSKEISNTFLLEQRFGWRGIAVEIDKKRSKEYNRNRESPCIAFDATKLNYEELFLHHGAPPIIDYLQVDIEPASNSFKALTSLPFSTTKFRTITFEHDAYHGKENLEIQKKSFLFLQSFGYTRVAENVKNSGLCYEDWYILPELVHERFLNFSLPPNTEYKEFFVYS